MNIAAFIDHTILKPDAVRSDVVRVCEEACRHQFASVCVNGCWVPLVRQELASSGVAVCTVIAFPLGAMAISAKRSESEIAVREGATELDMVLNVGALRAGDFKLVREDIAAVVDVAGNAGALVKVILETSLLTDENKRDACRIAVDAGAGFVKTSTGFGSHGATPEDVALMRAAVGPAIGVKASGGIRTYEQFRTMLDAGANRVGASASVAIVEAAGA